MQIWGSNPDGAKFSARVQTHPASCTVGTGSLLYG